MANTQALCTSFKQEILVKGHDFTVSTGDSFKMSLYTSSATLSAATTAYTATNEVSGGSYVATGQVLTNVTPTTSGTTALTDFVDETWTTVTITARGAMIYNDDMSDAAVCILDFGSDKTATAGDFTVVVPTADASNAIIRIA